MKKRLLSLVLCLVMAFSLFPAFGMSALAADSVTPSGTLSVDRLGVSAETDKASGYSGNEAGAATCTLNGQTITGYVAGTGSASNGNQTTIYITLTNNNTVAATLYFSYTAKFEASIFNTNSGYVQVASDPQITSSSSTKTGTFNRELAAGASIQVVAQASAGYNQKTTVTLSSVSLTPSSSGGDDPTLGTGGYQIAYNGLQVGDQIDMSRQYYIKDGNEYKPVQITNAQYFTEQTQGWTVQTGVGKYYLPADASTGTPDSFRLVSNGNGDLYTPHSDLKYRTVINTEYLKSLTWYYGIPTDYYYPVGDTFYKVYGEWQGKAARFHGKLYYYNKTDGNESTAPYIATRGNTGDHPQAWTDVEPNYTEIETSSAFIYGGNPNVGATLYTKDQGANSLTYVDANGVTHTIGNVLTINNPNQVLYTGPLYDKSIDYGATKIVYTNGATIGEDYKEGTVLTNQPLYWFDPTGQSGTVEPNHYDSDPDLGVLLDENTNFDGNLFLKKGLYFDQTSGEYGIKLESWATGTMSKSGSGGPTDIVIVVDLSDSMRINKDVYKNGVAISRIQATREAISDFIDTVHEADPNGDNYRIAIASFAGDPEKDWKERTGGVFLFNGSTFYYKNTDIIANADNALKKVDASGVDTLKKTINEANPIVGTYSSWGTTYTCPNYDNTYPEYGLNIAYNVLSNRSNASGRDAAVILFTDGFPGTTTNAYSKYADPAIVKADQLKSTDTSQGGLSAEVYTVGLFGFTDTQKWMNYQWVSTQDTETYTVAEYMTHTSSEYLHTEFEEIEGRSDHALKPIKDIGKNTDGKQYYFKVNTTVGNVDLSALKEAFSSIASTIAVTDVNANADSVLGDVINTNNLSIAGAQMKATTVTADDIDAYKNIHWKEVEGQNKEDEQPLVANQNWTNVTSATVGVSGFDYTKSFTAYDESGDHNLGKKLIVRIKGLTPEKGGNSLLSNGDAGIYTEAGDETPFLSVDSPNYTIPTKTMVIDFNAPMNLSPVAGQLKKQTNNNGSFELDENTHTLTYQLGYKSGEKISKGADISLSGTDSALAYVVRSFDSTMTVSAKGAELKQDSGWTDFIAVPASSVYFDDELLEAQAVDIGTGSSYNSEINTGAAASIGAAEQGGNIQITFTGSRIDAYCTTTAEGKSVTANLKDLAGTILTDKNGKKCNVTMKNQSANESRQNVPTVSFDMGDKRVGKYVLTLKDYYNGDYKLDGIRVYHPVGVNTDETALYTVTKDPDTNAVIDSELNARFVNLRALLAENLQDQVAAHEADVQEHADDPDYVEPTLSTIAFFTDRDGVATIADYIKDGPKNEIYLDQGEAIGFSIMNYDQYNTGDNHGKVMIGLSVQSETAGQVTINNDTANPQTVSSKTDMYYKINPTLDGTMGQVIIKNTGYVKIAITNLKVTGVLSLTPSITEIGAQTLAVDDALSTTAVPEAFVEPSLSINRSLLTFAQNPYPAETGDSGDTTDPEPTQTPLQELVMQLISNFVKALFNSIARLFGN